MIHSVLVDNRRYHYWQGGKGDDVVLVHGVGANLAMWHFTIAAELLKTHRLTMYDLRGHGRSDMPPTGYTTHHMTEDLLGILDVLELERVILIGHSFGADIALHFALQHPRRVHGLVAIEAGLPALFNARRHPEWSGWDEWTRLLEAEAGIRKNPADWHRIYTRLRNGEHVSQADISSDRALPGRGKRLVQLLTRTTMIRDYETDNEINRRLLASLTTPTLLVYGAASSYRSTLDVLEETLPRACTHIVPHADHFSVLQQPLAAPIGAFLGTRGGHE